MKKGFQPILDYVEGRMSITEFQFLFETDKSLQRTLKLPMDKKYTGFRDYNYNVFNFLKGDCYKNKSWNCISLRDRVQEILCVFLDNQQISYKRYPLYMEEYRFLLQIQPDYIDCQPDSILQPIIDSIPKDLSKTKRIAMGKEKVKALFKYDKTYPRWVQEAEWPIVNGKSLVFSHQKKAKGGDIRTYYYFYDPDTKEQTVVEQFD